MFNTKNIGIKISELRKKINMTQMQLADEMNVSYQAISNWERGSSMPDISKLPQLASVFKVSIDEILNEEKQLELVKNIINGDENNYFKEHQITYDNLSDVAPILTSTQTQDLIALVRLNNGQEKANPQELLSIAPFVSSNYLEELIKDCEAEISIEDLCSLAPFLAENTIDEIAKRLSLSEGIEKVACIAPFISQKVLEELAKQAYAVDQFNEICALLPFLSDDTLDFLVDKAIEKSEINGLITLAPFLSTAKLDALVLNNIISEEQVLHIMPFLSNDLIKKLANTYVAKKDFKALAQISPFLD